VASARLDGFITLRGMRSVDVAAGQLIVREAGGHVAFPDAGPNPGLGLDMRSRVLGATSEGILEMLRTTAETIRP
jgi:myo-inositol-1(or 4)-monophosphatase